MEQLIQVIVHDHLAFVLTVANTEGELWSSRFIESNLKIKQLIFHDLLQI